MATAEKVRDRSTPAVPRAVEDAVAAPPRRPRLGDWVFWWTGGYDRTPLTPLVAQVMNFGLGAGLLHLNVHQANQAPTGQRDVPYSAAPRPGAWCWPDDAPDAGYAPWA